ncbi:LLM class flavin-dependent oxidoreductase [Bacillus salipaludis]|uniref:LLM class flavin-dependent oxidoreductase n=1 Tax=Bacillus salipaludis TaxID=2547811 RepID=A0A4R5VMT3_9BACI|nr:LLM class flavin-dependent oxidoreductase [Bacillus salipaludis]MDQ6598251.1 LLM class flavin-dependent oxidoreductase [Bacillus salipaludis]TDK59373.1 LLM class flavin-dependent oxidoreductase [Bacillus salipaludis]
MKLSILDQSPISSNQTAQDALIESMKLAQAGESLGYTRYWIAEHHDLPGLACSAPEVMLSYIGAHTKKIRIGSGAVLLPHYKPYKVAEVYNMLATLFPNRIDIGIGRAPGGSAEVTNALSDNFLQQVYKMPNLVEELIHFFDHDFPKDHKYATVAAAPIPDTTPMPWILGTSKKSALLAAENGLSYAFGQFMSENDGAAIIEQYLNAFQPRKQGEVPEVLLTVTVICAETSEEAEEIALSNLIWALQKEKGEGQYIPSIQEAKEYELDGKEIEKLAKMKQNMIIGNPKECKNKLIELQAKYKVDEIMIVTITDSPRDRIESYKLIAAEVLS